MPMTAQGTQGADGFFLSERYDCDKTPTSDAGMAGWHGLGGRTTGGGNGTTRAGGRIANCCEATGFVRSRWS